MRIVWVTLGLISVGFGAVGVFLPLLPTVPFMILAAFCFARSSERLHYWLLNHRAFGPAITDWRDRGAISRRVKFISTVSVAAVFGISLLLAVKPVVLGIQALALAGVLIFIWSRPDY